MSEGFAMQGHRAHMEDRFSMLADPERSVYLYGVFDGHGGKAAAEYAEKHLFSAVLERLRHHSGEVDISTMQDILRQEILRVDEEFVKESKKTRDVSGTTCLVAAIIQETLIVANVGDSRGVMATEKGRAVPLSFDHKPQQIKLSVSDVSAASYSVQSGQLRRHAATKANERFHRPDHKPSARPTAVALPTGEQESPPSEGARHPGGPRKKYTIDDRDANSPGSKRHPCASSSHVVDLDIERDKQAKHAAATGLARRLGPRSTVDAWPERRRRDASRPEDAVPLT
ncbi:protein phosphatase 1L-like [Tropilaelaps mercedesae]|uniref:Protein phosphatase 1L-like n=1 Tax=Tropilaelaps mercedesae TaxID=418985 RepID=A0A1V9X3G3_9ACAR|nr:protein phosphatase 1L-like [Tropilaelaps mercedesae]